MPCAFSNGTYILQLKTLFYIKPKILQEVIRCVYKVLEGFCLVFFSLNNLALRKSGSKALAAGRQGGEVFREPQCRTGRRRGPLGAPLRKPADTAGAVLDDTSMENTPFPGQTLLSSAQGHSQFLPQQVQRSRRGQGRVPEESGLFWPTPA